MIVLDTHIWIWWTGENSELTKESEDLIRSVQAEGIGVSSISCWEIALLHTRQKLDLSESVLRWLEISLSLPNIILLPLSARIAVESNNLPGEFHKDPADRIIVATARIYDCPLITYDPKISEYPRVKSIP
ncbi:MAG: type II toxin-antitoxin system VapC family toxin [Blastocatellia bacterium]